MVLSAQNMLLLSGAISLRLIVAEGIARKVML